MATQDKVKKRTKPWRARVKMDYVSYALGYFETKEEAEKQEQKFRNYYKASPSA